MDTIGLLLRKRDVKQLGRLSDKKYRTLVETGALRPLMQRGSAKHLFTADEVRKVVEV